MVRRAPQLSLRLKPLVASDGVLLQNDLRPWDAFEAQVHKTTASGFVEDWLTRWQDSPYTFAASVWAPDNVLVACGGIRVFHADESRLHGKAWLLATNALRNHRRAFWRLSCWFMDNVAPHWASLDNAIPEGRDDARRWLMALGFDFGPAFMHPSGVRMLPFTWRRGSARRDAAGPF